MQTGRSRGEKIELANPSPKAVSYAVRLEGCADFTADARGASQAHGKTQLPVTFEPTTSVPESCRLILSSARGSGAAAATLVFALEPDVLVDAVKVITVSARPQLTDVVHLESLPGGCEFVISCENLGEVAEDRGGIAGRPRPSPAVSRRRRGYRRDTRRGVGGARSLPRSIGVPRRVRPGS